MDQAPSSLTNQSRQRLLVILNPAAGRRHQHRRDDVVLLLQTLGCKLTVCETRARGDAERLAAEADGTRFDAVVAAGGDGTINEVLNGLPPGAPPLALLPLGTVNVLAREIALSTSVEMIARTIVDGRHRSISLGEANGRRFAMMASVGLDANVVESIDLGLKRRIGKWAYLYQALRQNLRSPPPAYALHVGDRQGQASGVIVANGRCYGGGYVAAPAACLESPSLEVCRMIKPGRAAAPSYLASMALGRLSKRADFLVDRVTSVTITGPSDLPVQGDGDLLCRLPATIGVLPKALELVFPLSAPPSVAEVSGERAAPPFSPRAVRQDRGLPSAAHRDA